MSLILKISFGGREHEMPSAFTFKRQFGLTDQKLYCAKLDPAYKIDNESVEYIFYNNFSKDENEFIFLAPCFFDLSYDNSLAALRMEIIDPVPYPIRADWNPGLTGKTQESYSNLFFLSPYSADSKPVFLKTVKCNWLNLENEIKSALLLNDNGLFGLSAGYLVSSNSIPEMITMESFFDGTAQFDKAKAINFILVSSFKEFTLNYKNIIVSSKNVSIIPKSLIHRIVKKEPRNQKWSRLEKQMLRILFNGGVYVDIFDKEPKLIVKDESSFFKKADFERSLLQLGSGRMTAPRLDKFKKLFEEQIEGMQDYLLHPVDESSLRSIFWDPLIQKLFRLGLEKQDKNFILKNEWRTKELFPKLDERKIDFVTLITPNEIAHPILLVEAGFEPFSWNNPHKDTPKLFGNMSQSCIRLAKDLASSGKSPYDARVYGMLIGETTVQLAVAHPVITKVVGAMNDYNIHSNVTSDSHWIFDICGASQVTNCARPCHAPPVERGSRVLESLEGGEIEANRFPVVFSKQSELRDIVLDTVSEEVGMTAVADPTNTRIAGTSLCSSIADINWVEVERLNNFIVIIKTRINLIMATRALNLKFKRMKFGSVESVIFTPGSTVRRRISTDPSKSPTNNRRASTRVILTKSFNPTELAILKKLSSMPHIFPLLYSYEFDEAGKIELMFEELEPVESNGFVSTTLHCEHPEDSLLAGIDFTLQLLYGLYILHEFFHIIHSDISPGNVMYSSFDQTWKLIDFNQSMDCEESIKTSRRAGTFNYIAPESQSSGIFSQKSDIYSLGRVIEDFVLSVIIKSILLDGKFDDDDSEDISDSSDSDSESDSDGGYSVRKVQYYKPKKYLLDPELRNIASHFIDLIHSMIVTDPMQRPSIKTLLEKVYNLRNSYYHDNQSDVIFLAVRLLIKEEIQSVPLKPFKETLDSKRSKVDDEKEPMHDINLK